jgi:hypothetical protein
MSIRRINHAGSNELVSVRKNHGGNEAIRACLTSRLAIPKFGMKSRGIRFDNLSCVDQLNSKRPEDNCQSSGSETPPADHRGRQEKGRWADTPTFLFGLPRESRHLGTGSSAAFVHSFKAKLITQIRGAKKNQRGHKTQGIQFTY